MSLQDSLPIALRTKTLSSADEVHTQWNQSDVLLFPELSQGPYIAGLACSERCVCDAQRLRYEVFNLELGEGLSISALSGLDEDEFDSQMEHIVLIEQASGAIIGTYRVQTIAHAMTRRGLYSAREFDVSALAPYARRAVECGRACVAEAHRCMQAIHVLWLGIGAYLNLHACSYVFGCCSLTTRDPDDGWRALKGLRGNRYVHPELWLHATPSCSCGHPTREQDSSLGEALRLPKLFKAYMRMGALVISEPAIDRDFGTVDFLILMDARKVNLSRLGVVK